MSEHILSFFHRREYIELLIERGIKVFVIIAGVIACAKLIRLASRRVLEAARRAHPAEKLSTDHDKRLATVVRLLDTTLRIAIYVTGILMMLRECGFDIAPFLAGAGIAGVAVGFGSQSLVKDMISGVFLLVEDQIRIGDVIKINSGLSGSVERMELRVTAIRDSDGTLHIVPNGQIQSVSNMTYGFGTAVVDIPVPYATEIEKLNVALKKVLADFDADARWKPQLLDSPNLVGIVKFEPDHMVAELTVRTRPHSRWAVATELRRRSKTALDEAGIPLPKGFTVHLVQEPTSGER